MLWWFYCSSKIFVLWNVLDSTKSAVREVGFYFPEFKIDEWFVKDEPLFSEGQVEFDEENCIHRSIKSKE